MNVHILGSRIYAPITDIDRELQQLPAETVITAFGESDVCKRAVLAGTSLGLEARNVTLSSSRRELVEAAKQPDAHVLLFVAKDPLTKVPTEGMAGISSFLASQRISYRQVDSPLPGRVCALVTKLRQAVDRALATQQEHRKIVITNRALKIATEVVDERDRYQAKLEAGMHLMPDDEQATNRWLMWLSSYEELCRAIEDARSLLTPAKAIAA